MKKNSAHEDVGQGSRVRELASGQLSRIEGCRDQVILCRAGCLLISQYGDAADHALYPGEKLTLTTNRLVLVEACVSASAFELLEPDCSCAA